MHESHKGYIPTASWPDGSVLGSLPNVMYNEMFIFPVPDEATIVGFADELAMLVEIRHPEDVEVYSSKSVGTVKIWLEKAELTLTVRKTVRKMP